MNGCKANILFVHNIMAPYRLPIFRELSKTFDLKLLFLRITHSYRRWYVTQEELGFPSVVSSGMDLFGARIPFDLWHELMSNKYDVLIVAETSVEMMPSCLIAVFYKLARGARLILMSERFENETSRRQESPVKRAARSIFDVYLRFVYHHCDAFVACSSKAAEYLSRTAGIQDEKIFRSVQAVFDFPRAPSGRMKRRDESPVTILTMAYLEARKNIGALISAFKNLNAANARLVIAGDGEEKHKLEALASGSDTIVFAGYVDGAAKQGLYETADIFVLPSLFETWGLVVNEAMHYGLPVIITDSMGSTDLIDGNGFIVTAGDHDALLRALQQLIESRQMREKMGERSREIIRSANLDAVTKPFADAVSRVMGQNR